MTTIGKSEIPTLQEPSDAIKQAVYDALRDIREQVIGISNKAHDTLRLQPDTDGFIYGQEKVCEEIVELIDEKMERL